MMTLRNPFSDDAPLNQPIEQEALAEVLFWACQSADLRALSADRAFRDMGLAELCSSVRRYHWDAPPMHPAAIHHRFRGATTSVLHAISELYCDRVGRSAWTVIEIMRGLATEAGAEPLDLLAVWTFCTHFEERRREKQEPTIELLDSVWRIEVLHPPIRLIDRTGVHFTPQIFVVIDAATGRVIAFRVSQPEPIHALPLCLYAAIVSQRKPSVTDRSGVQWNLPKTILSESGEVVGSLRSRCQEFPFEVNTRHIDSNSPAGQTVANLRGTWTQDLRQEAVQVNRFEQIFDNFLWRFHGSGPERSLQENATAHSSRIGYNQDPADLYPSLRHLLPAYPGRIESGRVHHGGLTYEDPLLRLWPDRVVSVIPSQAAEAYAWIYVDDNVVCKAGAIELRRVDGSYRPFRERS